ncbi:SMP-30/gluconolactonase/LRE family protein [Rhodohalobacter sp. 614A]|uniref:SMP-30/gluconolactonase/LRE family protein n=1 Tax=Rhodohalobacter sp. 614A TaxID=2908649 RepID=UPI001F22AF5D|nr:SMP-30/gluconolactonase/LRE family protein [Rhodohalobacter sp. 614A]
MNIPTIEAEPVLAQNAVLGECPVWDDRQSLLFWVDILSGNLFQYDPRQHKCRVIDIGEHIGSFALREKNGAILALKSGFAFYDFYSNRIERMINPESHLSNNRFNDGKCDPYGRFWSGTLSYNVEKGAGSLYTLSTADHIETKLKNLTIPNGMAWHLGRKKFYFIDSTDRKICQFDYDPASGSIRNRSVLFEFPTDESLPDGMTLDADGHLWVALYNGFKVVRINPVSAQIEFQVELPVPQVTSCTFGGSNMNELYITTAREHMTKKEIAEVPLSGSLFRAVVPFRGLKADRFKG